MLLARVNLGIASVNFVFFILPIAQTIALQYFLNAFKLSEQKEPSLVGISIYTTAMIHTAEIIYLHL